MSGLVEAAGGPAMGMFDLTPIAGPAALAVIVWFGLIDHRLLPNRGGGDAGPTPTECLFEAQVPVGSALEGKTVAEVGLRHLGGAHLAHIEPRGGQAVPGTPGSVLRDGDRLLFVGDLGVLDDLVRAGLERPPGASARDGLPLFEAVVAVGSDLAGRSLREVQFRERFGGVVLGVRRRQRALVGGLGRTPLEAGDLLLIKAPEGFAARWGRDRDTFVVVARIRPARPVASPIRRAVIGVSAGFGVPIATTAFLGALATVAAGCLSAAEARRAVGLQVLVVIGAAFGLGQAIEAVGIATAVASAVATASGPMGVIVAVFVATCLLTEVITNNAAADLMVGVGLESARAVGAPPEAVAIAIAVAASCSFLTLIGYQTNMMVMSSGQYRFSDFLVSGAVTNGIVGVVSLTMIWLLWL